MPGREIHKKIVILLIAMLLVVGCQSEGQRKQFVVGVAQSFGDEWHRQLKRDIIKEAAFYEAFRYKFTSAVGSHKQQVAQIEQFIREGVDLIVVLPCDSKQIVEVIDKAESRGIPVVVVDNAVEGDRYSAYIGVDQSRMGHWVASNIAQRLGRTAVFELLDWRNAERSRRLHDGMVESLAKIGRVDHIGGVTASRDSVVCVAVVDSLLEAVKSDLLIFCHTRAAARIASSRVEMAGRREGVKIWDMGVMAGKSGGVDMVYKGAIDGTYSYPTGGDVIVESVAKILNGEEMVKVRRLTTPFVDESNVKIYRKQLFANNKYNVKIKGLNSLMAQESKRSSQRIYLLLALVIAIVIFSVLFIVRLVKRRIKSLSEVTDAREAVAVAEAARESAEALAKSIEVGAKSSQMVDDLPAQERKFIDRFYEIIDRNLSNDRFEIESIGDELHYSRVQVYRKVKAITGESPVKVLRNRRLLRADHLLKTTDKTISEIAFEVGFVTPSYFSKNYKDLFGVLPSAVKRD